MSLVSSILASLLRIFLTRLHIIFGLWYFFSFPFHSIKLSRVTPIAFQPDTLRWLSFSFDAWHYMHISAFVKIPTLRLIYYIYRKRCVRIITAIITSFLIFRRLKMATLTQRATPPAAPRAYHYTPCRARLYGTGDYWYRGRAFEDII